MLGLVLERFYTYVFWELVVTSFMNLIMNHVEKDIETLNVALLEHELSSMNEIGSDLLCHSNPDKLNERLNECMFHCNRSDATTLMCECA